MPILSANRPPTWRDWLLVVSCTLGGVGLMLALSAPVQWIPLGLAVVPLVLTIASALVPRGDRPQAPAKRLGLPLARPPIRAEVLTGQPVRPLRPQLPAGRDYALYVPDPRPSAESPSGETQAEAGEYAVYVPESKAITSVEDWRRAA